MIPGEGGCCLGCVQVIETSGVTDPVKIIATLDQRFGKMTRARLDSVVTVLDADSLAGLEGGGSGQAPMTMTAALRSQLRYADVILLNKADLCSPDRYIFPHENPPRY